MKLASLFICLIFSLSCTRKDLPVDDKDAVSAISEMSRQRAQAFNAGDAGAIAKHFTEDGILMAPGKPLSRGREDVEAYYAEIFREFETVLESYYEEVEVSGDLGYGRGEARVTLISKVTRDTAYASSKYLNILKKQADGTWLTTHDIWNDN